MSAMKTMKGAAWLVGSRFVGRIIDLFTLLIFVRVLTPADFGLTALAMTVVLIVDTVLEVPVTQALTRLPAIDKTHLDTGFTLGLLRGFGIALVILIASWPVSVIYDNAELAPIMIALAVGPVLRSLASPRMVEFMRDMSFSQIFMMEVFGKAVAFVAAVSTVLAGGGYWALVVNFATAGSVGAIASYVIAPYRPSLSLRRFNDFASFVGWFSLAQFVSALNWQSDRLLLGAYVDKPTLGRYAVSGDLAVLPIQSLILPAMMPVMAAFARIGNDRERQRFAFLKAARFAMMLSVPLAVGIALVSDLVVALLLGAQWREAAPILSLLALSVVGIPYFQTLYSLALAIDRPSLVFRLNATELAVRIVLLPVGLALLAAPGVALARIGVLVVMFAAYLFHARSLIGAGIGDQLLNLWKIVAAAGVMVLAVLGLRHVLLPLGLPPLLEAPIVVGAGALTYALALVALGLRLAIGGGRFELYDRQSAAAARRS